MEINDELINHIAALSRLHLTKEETEKFKAQFREILNAFSKIKEVDTDNIKPSFQPVSIMPHLRDDKEGKCQKNEDILALTEHKKDGYFKGPKVI